MISMIQDSKDVLSVDNSMTELSELCPTKSTNTDTYYNLSSMKSLIQYICNNSRYTSTEIFNILKLVDNYFDESRV